MLEVDFLNLFNYVQIQNKIGQDRIGSICQLDVFLFKLRSLLEVDFQY